jgi:hypothetical protein
VDNWSLVRALTLGVCFCLFAAKTATQYLIRALYQGRAEEEIRRNYNQNFEYYLDRFSFVDMPPWWNEPLEPFRNRFFVGGGSI